MSDSNIQNFFNNFSLIKSELNIDCDSHPNTILQDIYRYLNMINSKINTLDIKIRKGFNLN